MLPKNMSQDLKDFIERLQNLDRYDSIFDEINDIEVIDEDDNGDYLLKEDIDSLIEEFIDNARHNF